MIAANIPEGTTVNIGSHQGEPPQGILQNHPDFQNDLLFWWRHAASKRLSQAQAAKELGVDAGTYSRVLRGEYKNSTGGVLPVPAKMLSRIRVLQSELVALANEERPMRVMTGPTMVEIMHVCQKAWDEREIGFIWGVSHVGKTEGLRAFKDANPTGRVLYVDLQDCAGTTEIWQAIAAAAGLSPNVALKRLKPRVMSAIGKDSLLLFDEFHTLSYSLMKGASLRMQGVIKAIKDKTGCAAVICATEWQREEMESGDQAKFMMQMSRRGVIKLHLPSKIRVGDVREWARASDLPFPDAPARKDDLWVNVPKFAGLEVCEAIATDHGVKHFFSVVRDGRKLAAKQNMPLAWSHVIEAQRIYNALSNPKKEV